MLELYYAPGACSLAPHIALEEAGAVYEAISVNLARGAQTTPDFLGLNPKGRVPVLVTDQGVLTENPAILMYIAMTWPQAVLAPLNDPFELARVQSFNAYLSSTVHVAHAHGPRGSRWADQPASLADMKQKVPQNMKASFAYIENECFKGPWVMGQTYTICDAYLFTIASWLESDGVDAALFPKVLDHRNRMRERPAVKRVLAREAGST